MTDATRNLSWTSFFFIGLGNPVTSKQQKIMWHEAIKGPRVALAYMPFYLNSQNMTRVIAVSVEP